MKRRFNAVLLMMLAGWMNRHQQERIEYLKAENKILREKLGKKRLLLNYDQPRQLAVLGRSSLMMRKPVVWQREAVNTFARRDEGLSGPVNIWIA